MAPFSAGDQVRCVQRDHLFEPGDICVVHAMRDDAHFRIRLDAGDRMICRVRNWELVTPAEPARLTRKVVQRDVTANGNGQLIHTLWYDDESFSVFDPSHLAWLHFSAPDKVSVPQPESV